MSISSDFLLAFVDIHIINWLLVHSVKDIDSLKIEDIEASAASECCNDELSDDVFTKPLVLAKGLWSFVNCVLLFEGLVLWQQDKGHDF